MQNRNAGDFSDVAGEWEMAPKCKSLPQDAGDLVGLVYADTRDGSRDLRMAVPIPVRHSEGPP